MTPPAYNMQAAYTYWYTTSPDVVLTNNSTSEDGMAKRASTSTATDSGFMGILSAERYNDGRAISNPKQRNLGGLKQASQSKSPTMDTGGVFGLSGGFEARQMPSNSNPSNSNSQSQKQTQHEQQRPSDADMGGRRRKKPKISDEEEEEEEEDEAAKKSRGRPRLDTKDETAADRRRTQIRMAQRAYRHRKETTIASLEKQVETLQNANEEMNNIFIKLYDVAMQKGLLAREPEFGQCLQTTTQRFLALAKSTDGEENANEADSSINGDGNKPGQSETEVEPVTVQQTPPFQQFISEDEQPPSVTTSAWGYEIHRSDPIEVPMSNHNYFPPVPVSSRRFPEHQIIAQATPENASFSFDSFDYTNLQQYNASLPNMDSSFQVALRDMEALPLPKTYGDQESTFARRLQRCANERGWRLITSPNPPPTRFQEVFGFCLQFESKEAIIQRMSAFVGARSSKDPLFNWRVPFVHLGGAGTHYPLSSPSISGDLQPKCQTGSSMGPFNADVVRVQQNSMMDNYRINIPGWEGEFFDANDVEGYLRTRGIDIPAAADFIVVDLDLIPELLSTDETPCPLPFTGSSGGVEDGGNSLGTSEYSSARTKSFTIPTPPSPVQLRGAGTGVSDDGAAEQAVSQIYPENSISASLSTPLEFTGWTAPPPTKPSRDPFDFAFSSASALQQQQPSLFDSMSKPGRIVTLNIAALVDNLISRAVCLGRAPGFRPADIEGALRRTIHSSW